MDYPREMKNPNEMHNPHDFHMLLDEIISYLWQGEAWHEKTANECRKLALRGFRQMAWM